MKDVFRIQSVCTMRMPIEFALENARADVTKSSVSLKMKEVYYKNLHERA